MDKHKTKRGLFIGLVTGDLIYLAAQPPQGNEKVTALDYCFTAGGPATNAAIAFRYYGSQTTLLAALGEQQLGRLLGEELTNYGVDVMNIGLNRDFEPPISSVIVTESTGDRSVISLNSQGFSTEIWQGEMQSLHGYDVVLVDGHLMGVGAAIASQSKGLGIPVVVDAGSWKANFDKVLSYTDFAICSVNFLPPNCHNYGEVVQYLQHLGVKAIAITRGADSILWWEGDRQGEISVPKVKVVDTLGAGDIFHGAFCHYILAQDFVSALTSAAKVASYSCEFFGTRRWLAGDCFRSE